MIKSSLLFIVLLSALTIVACSCGRGSKDEIRHDTSQVAREKHSSLQPEHGVWTRIDLELHEDTLDTKIKEYLSSGLNSVLGTSDVEFDSDSAFEFNQARTQSLAYYGWTIFVVDGQFIPSTVEFRVFGAFKNETANCIGLSSSLAGTRAEVQSCDVSKSRILLYGIDPAPHEELAEAPVEILAAFHPEILVNRLNPGSKH